MGVYLTDIALTRWHWGLGAAVLFDLLIGVINTRNLYWIALAYLLFTAALCWWARGRAGSWQAVRENERRVEVMGLRPYTFKLFVFAVSAVLAALYMLLVRGASPAVTTGSLSLALLVMVVLGGAGTLWGAIVGGALYQYLDQRLVALASSDAVAGLPAWLRAPLGEPLFILGALFIALVLFFPGGIAGAVTRVRLPRRAA
jgi:branched-chain amino acid transport system permease protein